MHMHRQSSLHASVHHSEPRFHPARHTIVKQQLVPYPKLSVRLLHQGTTDTWVWWEMRSRQAHVVLQSKAVHQPICHRCWNCEGSEGRACRNFGKCNFFCPEKPACMCDHPILASNACLEDIFISPVATAFQLNSCGGGLCADMHCHFTILQNTMLRDYSAWFGITNNVCVRKSSPNHPYTSYLSAWNVSVWLASHGWK